MLVKIKLCPIYLDEINYVNPKLIIFGIISLTSSEIFSKINFLNLSDTIKRKLSLLCNETKSCKFFEARSTPRALN